MAHAYTPGLQVTDRTRYRAKRVLPIAGDVLVSVGDAVQARDVVARTELPGDITPINLANQLSMPPGEAPAAMLKQAGDRIEVGELLARTKGIFGMFKGEYHARVAGTLESVSNVTGQVIIRGEPLPVDVQGVSVRRRLLRCFPREGCVVEAEAAFVQGIFGIGGEAYGPIRMACAAHTEEFSPDLLQE